MIQKRFITKILYLLLIISAIIYPGSNFDLAKKAQAADFNSSNLIEDGTFVNINAMDTASIQRFLEERGSYLKEFSENGRSAAQIIHDAAHGSGDASGSINGIDINGSTGTVNPQVILVTLQKEQSLISNSSYDERALRVAMGYGCPDSGGCNSSYYGFTKQVENAAWQLRYNFERSSGHGFGDYQVGQSFCFDDWNGNHCGKFDDRATASLYRYTPHVYNGNYNFWNLFFNTYQFTTADYSCNWYTQNANPTLMPGEAYQFEVKFKNTGRYTWTKNIVHLATDRGRDRIPWMIREGDGPSGWVTPNRIVMVEDGVAPGGIGTFRFWMRMPNGVAPGNYEQYFRLVADGYNWMEDWGVYWNVRVPTDSERYSYQWVNQNEYPTLDKGNGYNFVVRIKNTGSATWYKHIMRLGTDRDRDRIPGFVRADLNNLYGHPSGWTGPNRILMQEESVAPGGIATFSFWMSAPADKPSGTYKEYFRVVADGVGWLEDYGIFWDVTVN